MLNEAQQQSLDGLGRRAPQRPQPRMEVFHAAGGMGVDWDHDHGYSHAGTMQAALDRVGTGRGTMFRLGVNPRDFHNDPDRPVSDEFANAVTGTPDESGSYTKDVGPTYDDEVVVPYTSEPALFYRNAAEDEGSISTVAPSHKYEVLGKQWFDNRQSTVHDGPTRRTTTTMLRRDEFHPSGYPAKDLVPDSMWNFNNTRTIRYEEPRLFDVDPSPDPVKHHHNTRWYAGT